MGLSLNHFLVLGALLFCIGLYGALTKRNAIAVLMGIEIMLNAVNVTMVGFAFYNTVKPWSTYLTGQIFAIFYYHRCSSRSGGRISNDYIDLSQTQYGRRWRNKPDEVVKNHS